MESNKLVAQLFEEMAQLLELTEANPFRIRAYRRAGQTIESLHDDITEIAKRRQLEEISGIGRDLARKIEEIISTGLFAEYTALKKKIPTGVVAMLNIPGIGPKIAYAIYQKLHIEDVDALEQAALSGLLRSVEGIKEKTEKNIIEGIGLLRRAKEKMRLHYALRIAQELVAELKTQGNIEKIEIAGSLRRRKDAVKDIDIVAVAQPSLMDIFVRLPRVQKVLLAGKTKSSVLLREGIQVDLRIVEDVSFGAALLYLTGSKDFNIALRALALKKKLKINEYGVYREKEDGKKIAGVNEEEIFSSLALDYIPAVLREHRGEIEAAKNHCLPSLVQYSDIRGDFHVHSRYSDGLNSLEELASGALARGYEYLAVADHSRSLKIAQGLSEDALAGKIKEIERMNKCTKGLRLLCASEVDILADGTLDYPEDILRRLDLVIAAIHSGFKSPRKSMTRRICRALQSGFVHILAHPTGILSGVRDAYEVDMKEVIQVARDYGVALEIDCYPQRIDLDDLQARKAKEAGVKISLGTDSHKINHLSYMELGVWTAQRAWLEKADVLNTMTIEELRKWLVRR